MEEEIFRCSKLFEDITRALSNEPFAWKQQLRGCGWNFRGYTFITPYRLEKKWSKSACVHVLVSRLTFRWRMRDAQTVIGIIVPIKYRLPRFTWTRRSPLCTHHRLLYDHVAYYTVTRLVRLIVRKRNTIVQFGFAGEKSFAKLV